jgi:hypothetical protein
MMSSAERKAMRAAARSSCLERSLHEALLGIGAETACARGAMDMPFGRFGASAASASDRRRLRLGVGSVATVVAGETISSGMLQGALASDGDGDGEKSSLSSELWIDQYRAVVERDRNEPRALAGGSRRLVVDGIAPALAG